MVNPLHFGVNPKELCTKLANLLVHPDQRFVASHSIQAVRCGILSTNELAYLTAIASASLLEKGSQGEHTVSGN